MGFEFLQGAEAICRAAVYAGCDFFAGYPITPATSILIRMMKELPKRNRFAIQGEDEIASIGMCIAASMAGKKPMTATSGPGISLYSENISLAIGSDRQRSATRARHRWSHDRRARRRSVLALGHVRRAADGGARAK